MRDLANIDRGKKILSSSSIIVCSIVRDCAKNLSANINIINALCDAAKDYNVIIFENDSKDNTKKVLERWAIERKNISININDYNVTKTIPRYNSNDTCNPFYSRKRIEKMALYRNQYLEFIERNNLSADYVVVVDLDVAKIYLDGIIDSFGQERKWDLLAANGYSLSPKLTRRYHDTYALMECDLQSFVQTEKSIFENWYRFSFLKKGVPLIRVYSAFGGLSIYRFEVISGLRYKVISNNDNRVEVRCEHYGLNKQIHDRGYHKFYINPNMTIKYQKITLNLIVNSLVRFLKRNTE